MTTVYIITAEYSSSDFGGETGWSDCVAVCLHPRRAEELKAIKEKEEQDYLAGNPETSLGQRMFQSCSIVEMTIDEAP